MTNNIQDEVLERNEQIAADNGSTEKYLTFFIDKQLYAIPSRQVIEIIRMQLITYMPNLPGFVKGVINLRGKIVPLMDLRLKFDLEEKEYDEHTSIIVCDFGETSIGFIVDMVNDVTDISENKISEAPKLSKEGGNNYVCGIVHLEKNVALILDMLKVLGEEQANVQKVTSESPQE
jgi:purine-binding chemotaxis protein CheW